MKVLIDTNVLLDALLSRSPFTETAQKVFLLVAKNKIKAYITANSVTNLYYLLNKHLSDSDTCKITLEKIFTLFNILDLTEKDCKKALELPMTDYEDALLSACAKRERIDFIITRNLKDFVNSPVKAISPTNLLDRTINSKTS